MARMRVVFAHRPKKRGHGARIMRVDQLAAMAAERLGDRYEFQTLQLFREGQPRRQRQALRLMRGAVVIFLKGSGNCFDEEGLERLKTGARGLCVDHVDAFFGVSKIHPHADVHILASRAAMSRLGPFFAMKRIGGEAAHLTHHADPRITLVDHAAASAVKPIYFGQSFNSIIPEALRGRFAPEDFSYREDFAWDVARMPGANLHWTVREPGWRKDVRLPAFKPFTKGFNAAWAGANVVADRGQDDAVEYLGEDYPYLAEDASDEALTEAYAKAERTVGGEDWRRGLAQMAKVRLRTSPAVVMGELDAILKRFA